MGLTVILLCIIVMTGQFLSILFIIVSPRVVNIQPVLSGNELL